jgi:hypothetical protein
MEIKLQLPDENTPGILLFLRQISLFNQVLTDPVNADVDDIDEAYGFLLKLIVEPKDRKKAKAALFKLSMKELGTLFEGMNLGGEVDPKA